MVDRVISFLNRNGIGYAFFLLTTIIGAHIFNDGTTNLLVTSVFLVLLTVVYIYLDKVFLK